MGLPRWMRMVVERSNSTNSKNCLPATLTMPMETMTMVVMETETETEARSSSPPSYLSSEEVTDSGITVNSIKENTDQEIRNEGSGWLISWLCIHNKLRKGNKHERWK